MSDAPQKSQFTLRSGLIAVAAVALAFTYIRFMIFANEHEQGVAGFALFGMLAQVVSASSEIAWRGRLKRMTEKTTGRIVRRIRDRTSEGHPEIEFLFKDQQRRFVSKFDDYRTTVGVSVTVIYDPETGEAECFSVLNRWSITVFFGVFGLLFIGVGIAIWLAV